MVVPKREVYKQRQHQTLEPESRVSTGATEAPNTVDVLQKKVDILIKKRAARGHSVDRLDKVSLPPVTISRN